MVRDYHDEPSDFDVEFLSKPGIWGTAADASGPGVVTLRLSPQDFYDLALFEEATILRRSNGLVAFTVISLANDLTPD